MSREDALDLVLNQFLQTGDLGQIKEDLKDIYSKPTSLDEVILQGAHGLIAEYKDPSFPELGKTEVTHRIQLLMPKHGNAWLEMKVTKDEGV